MGGIQSSHILASSFFHHSRVDATGKHDLFSRRITGQLCISPHCMTSQSTSPWYQGCSLMGESGLEGPGCVGCTMIFSQPQLLVKYAEAEDSRNFARGLRFGVLERKGNEKSGNGMGERVREGEGELKEGKKERRWKVSFAEIKGTSL